MSKSKATKSAKSAAKAKLTPEIIIAVGEAIGEGIKQLGEKVRARLRFAGWSEEAIAEAFRIGEERSGKGGKGGSR